MNGKLVGLALALVAPLVCIYPGMALEEIGKGGPKVHTLKVTPDPNRGWLGVQLAEVSPALAAHWSSICAPTTAASPLTETEVPNRSYA